MTCTNKLKHIVHCNFIKCTKSRQCKSSQNVIFFFLKKNLIGGKLLVRYKQKLLGVLLKVLCIFVTYSNFIRGSKENKKEKTCNLTFMSQSFVLHQLIIKYGVKIESICIVYTFYKE